jgi:PqqA peptide cyclase
VLLDQERLDELVAAGLDHVQISFQDIDDAEGDRVAGYRSAQRLKREAAARVQAAGLPLTVNAVVHRQNLERLGAMIDAAVDLGARRLEVAHVQYYGWALANRAALLPTRAQLDAATATVEAARERLRGRLVIDYVVPDYHAALPKACMSGWGRRFMNLTPTGKALPCHAAETLPGFDFPSVQTMSLGEIWRDSDAFNRFRGTDWMLEPCRTCERREIDWGGCRCQAFALTGNAAATDPVCHRAMDRGDLVAAITATQEAPPQFVYRRMGSHRDAQEAAGPAPVGAAE